MGYQVVGKAEWKDEILDVGGMYGRQRGRPFQIAGAAERKRRAANEMLQRVTERRLTEADSRVVHGVWTGTVIEPRRTLR